MSDICPRCNETGWKLSEGDPTRVERCDCWQARQRRWAEDVPREFQDARLDNYLELPGNRAARRAADAFLAGDRDLVFIGPVGCGKTRLACSVLNDVYAATKQGWFVRVPLTLYKLQPGRTAEEAAEIAHLETKLMETALMAFDDVGAERDRASDFTRRTLLMLYEARRDAGLRTIWTSNKSLNELAQMQDDDRLASRLAGWATVVALTCPDQRMPVQEFAGGGR